MATLNRYKVFNVRQGVGRFLWFTVKATTAPKALQKASKQLGLPVNGAKFETVTIDGEYHAKLGNLATLLI